MGRLFVLFGVFLALGVASASPEHGGFAPDIESREEARAFFNAVYRASAGVESGWDGNVSEGLAGTTSAAFRESVLLRTNFFRAMAGVPADLALNEEYSRKAQQMALMISANVELSHFPSQSWLFYTEEGAEAARNANLALGDFGSSAIAGEYMKDYGQSNTSVGHRRWLLLPQLEEIGTGDIPKGTGDAAANALWVLDEGSIRNPRPAVRDDFVAWPPPGMVPYPVVYPRWSFSYPEADFAQTSVTVTDPQGDPVPLVVEHRSEGGSLPESTIVWRDISVPDSSLWPRPAADTAYDVVLSGVRIGNESRDFFYTVTIFDPAVTGPDFVEADIRAQEAVIVAGEPHSFQVSLPSYSTAFELREVRAEPFDRVESAANGLDGFEVRTSPGYSPLHEGGGGSTEAVFHLVHPVFQDQWLELDRTIFPSRDSLLSFRSRLGWASRDQIARVEVRIEGDDFWRELYKQEGTGDAGEADFVDRQLSLSAYAGKTLRVRFVYARRPLGSIFYPQTATSAGWMFNEIAISHAHELTSMKERGVYSGDLVSLVIDEPETVAFQVRPIAWGYGLEWGRVYSVTALETAPGYAEWAADLSGGPNEDSSGDGISNLLAYALGAEPTEAAVHRLPFPENGETAFSFSIPSSNKQDITYSVLRSADMISWREIARKEAGGSWEALEPQTAIETNATGTRIREPLSGEASLFFRLQVELREG